MDGQRKWPYGGEANTFEIQTDQISTSQGFVNLTILPLLMPAIATPSISANSVVLSGSGGAPGGGYHVLSSTDVTTPLTNWVSTGTGVFDGSGNFTFTNSTAGALQRFYILQVP